MRWVSGVWGEETSIPVTECANLLDVYLCSAGPHASESLDLHGGNKQCKLCSSV